MLADLRVFEGAQEANTLNLRHRKVDKNAVRLPRLHFADGTIKLGGGDDGVRQLVDQSAPVTVVTGTPAQQKPTLSALDAIFEARESREPIMSGRRLAAEAEKDRKSIGAE